MKNILLVSAISLLLASKTFAADPFDSTSAYSRGTLSGGSKTQLISNSQFFFKPLLSLEYSAPVISGGGTNVNFHTNNFGKQVSGFENIAIGGNFRIHKFFGFNANWAQTDLNNATFQDVGALSKTAHFKMDQYNFSALLYAPVIENFAEVFVEAGISDMVSKLNYADLDGNLVARNAHETMGIYGVGFQFEPWIKSDSAVRFSFQKYSGKLALLDSHYATLRIGYLKAF